MATNFEQIPSGNKEAGLLKPEIGEPIEISFDPEKAAKETEESFLDFDVLLKQYGVQVEEEQKKIKGQPGFEEEEEIIELVENDIEVFEKGVAGAKADFLDKVSKALGSNEGGWYENRETGEKYYLKFYENPNQARNEFIANRIYEKIGIPAAHSEIIEIDDRTAIANREIPDPKPASEQAMQENEDTRKGFIADAYLANWDVIGLYYDNIMESSNGKFYRVDNGGSLDFGATGRKKEFPDDDVPELVSMTNPMYESGKIFESVTEEEKKTQAKELIKALDDKFLKNLVKESGLPKEEADKILTSLIGRREFLKERFIGSRAASVVEELAEIPQEQVESGELLPQVEMKGDHDFIEDQQIDFVRLKDKTAAYFKISEENIQDVRSKVNDLSGEMKIAPLNVFDFENSTGKKIEVRRGLIGNEGNRIQLREGVSIDIVYAGPKSIEGQVKVDIDKSLTEQADEIMDEVGGFFKKLGIKDLWQEPPEKVLLKNSRDLFETQNRSKLTKEARDRIEYEEVYPGYVTAVEKDKHKEYVDKYGVKGMIMKIDDHNAAKILSSSGLMSSYERYKRGVIVHGPSTDRDFDTGGGSFVFTRAVNENALDRNPSFNEFFPHFDAATIIVDPSQLDRLDWFAYQTDNYGSTEPEKFDKRPSAKEFFEKEKVHFNDGNEVMFKRGIPKEAFKALVVDNGTQKNKVVEQLRNHGINEVNGTPVEEFVQVALHFKEYFKE